jgi:hypothetical protein
MSAQEKFLLTFVGSLSSELQPIFQAIGSVGLRLRRCKGGPKAKAYCEAISALERQAEAIKSKYQSQLWDIIPPISP